MCSGGMRRYMEEHTVAKAALWSATDAEARKAWVANRIRYPGSPCRKTMSAKCWEVSASQCCS